MELKKERAPVSQVRERKSQEWEARLQSRNFREHRDVFGEIFERSGGGEGRSAMVIAVMAGSCSICVEIVSGGQYRERKGSRCSRGLPSVHGERSGLREAMSASQALCEVSSLSAQWGSVA